MLLRSRKARQAQLAGPRRPASPSECGDWHTLALRPDAEFVGGFTVWSFLAAGTGRATKGTMMQPCLNRIGVWGTLALALALSSCGSSGESDGRVAASSGLLPGPSASDTDDGPFLEAPGAAAPIVSAPPPASLTADGADPSAPSPIGGGNGQVQPGTLTAGAWDDSQNLERFLEYRAELHEAQIPGLLDFGEQDHQAAASAAGGLPAHTTLDVALVIDTTGSMGDELTYLQSEFDALSSAIELEYPNAEQRWSLVVYRDEGDEYVARAFDFRAAGDEFRAELGRQSSGGGGDFPEASEAALAAMNQLAWRADVATARLAFWVTDAPHHAERVGALRDAIAVAQAQGVHLYPVASSGIDELTELTLRSAAQLTLGRYLFLTDDSGVGGAHKEPSIPCYFVTRLNDAILRMVDIEMSGVYREPDVGQVIRSGGNPTDGACVLESGHTVFVF